MILRSISIGLAVATLASAAHAQTPPFYEVFVLKNDQHQGAIQPGPDNATYDVFVCNASERENAGEVGIFYPSSRNPQRENAVIRNGQCLAIPGARGLQLNGARGDNKDWVAVVFAVRN